MTIHIGFAILIFILCFVVVFKLFRRVWSAVFTSLILLLIFVVGLTITGNLPLKQWIYEINPFISQTLLDTDTSLDTDLAAYYSKPLSADSPSTINVGSVAYGAVIQLGDLDQYGRSTFAHIRLSDDQEPGNHGETRDEYIDVDPAGWKNFKINGNWVNNRCHLIGYQFSGLNNELRNLSIGTAYLNKGTESSGTDEDNPDSMLFYEQRLDTWLYQNPENQLDLYVCPVYEGSNKTPTYYYMQWVGFTDIGETVSISIGGYSQTVKDKVNGVLLKNQSPSCTIDYKTGNIVQKGA